MDFTSLWNVKLYGQVGNRIEHPIRDVWVYELNIEEFYCSGHKPTIFSAKFTIAFGRQYTFGEPSYNTGDWILIYGNVTPNIKNDGNYLLAIWIDAYQMLDERLVNKLKQKHYRKINLIRKMKSLLP